MNVHLEKNQPPKSMERAYDLGMHKAQTPKSERPRHTYGSLEMSVQTVPGLCTLHRKCIKRDGHNDHCWPGD